jgi:hypothetical protein
MRLGSVKRIKFNKDATPKIVVSCGVTVINCWAGTEREETIGY